MSEIALVAKLKLCRDVLFVVKLSRRGVRATRLLRRPAAGSIVLGSGAQIRTRDHSL